MTPIDALFEQARLRPERTAFIAGQEAWSYRRLARATDRLALALLARGVRPGDRVALHMLNRPELVVAYYACFRIGAIAAPLNTRFKTAELRPLLERLRPALYLGQAPLYAQVAAIDPAILPAEARFIAGGGIDGRARSWADLIDGIGRLSALPDRDDNAPAALLATSGTTGVSKFVAHTPSTLSAISESMQRFGFDAPQVTINAVPMVHMSGFVVLLTSIRFGAPMVLFERFDADAVLDAIEPCQGSWLLGLPFMFAELMAAQRRRARKVDSLRFCISGGDVCPLPLQREFPRRFGVPLHSVWAATEVVGSLIHGLQPGAVSRIAPGAQFLIANDNGAPAPRGEVGELLLRGANVAVGYWTGPGRLDISAPDGWYHTGDLMRRGEGSDVWFVGRKKDLIIRGGSNISPVEVERVLMTHPSVRDAAVAGVPDPVLGQRVAAVVRLAGMPGSRVRDDILAHARTRLADYKVPERLEIVGEIPRNTLGKVDRRALAAWLSQAETDESAAAAS